MITFTEYAKDSLNLDESVLNRIFDGIVALQKQKENADNDMTGYLLGESFLSLMKENHIPQNQVEPILEKLHDYFKQPLMCYWQLNGVYAMTFLATVDWIVFGLDYNYDDYNHFPEYPIDRHSKVFDKILKDGGLRQDDDERDFF